MQKPALAALAATAVAAAATLPGLGSGTLWDNSETAYGEVAREIVIFHDWVVMHQNGAPWFVQPPLYFWIAALCIKVFGVSSLALRLPAALASLAMAGWTAYAAARFAGTRAGTYAGVVLATSLMQAAIGRLAIMDALLDAAVAWTILLWFDALQDGNAAAFLWGCVAVALGFLAKGPVAPAIALLVIVPYAIWEGRSRVRLPRAATFAAGAALCVAIAGPWFGALVARTGPGSIATLIGYYTIGRYTGTIENQSGPVWYYLPALIVGFFPWIAFLPSAIASAAQTLRVSPRDAQAASRARLLRLAVTWAVLPLLFFSFAKTKLPNYIALELPALAILCGTFLDEAVQRARSRSLFISTASVSLAIALLGVAAALFLRHNHLSGDFHALSRDLAYLGAAVFAGSLVALLMLLRTTTRPAAPYAIAAAMLAAMCVLALLMLPQAEALKPIPHLVPAIRSNERPGDALAIMNVAGGNALMFYTHPGIFILRTLPALQQTICNHPRTLLVAAKSAPLPRGAHATVIASYLNDNLYVIPRSCAI